MKRLNKIWGVLGVLWALPISMLGMLLILLLRPTGTRWALLRFERTRALVAWGGALADFTEFALWRDGGHDFGTCGFAQSALVRAPNRRA